LQGPSQTRSFERVAVAGLLCACTLAALLGLARVATRDRASSLVASSGARTVLELSLDRFPVVTPPATGATLPSATPIAFADPELPTRDPGPALVLLPPSRAPPV
jgi:hypothetical protein